MLTKKHLEALAATINETRDYYQTESDKGDESEVAACVVCRFMRKVEVTPLFNAERFCKAAGLGEEWYASFEAAAKEGS